jgi:predicted transcriptional regulator
MKTVIFEVLNPDESLKDVLQVWKTGKRQKAARINFASPELLWKVLTAKRWELLKSLCGAGPVSIREAARRVGRDVKGVHTDVTALLVAGVLDRTKEGAIIFPYEAVKVQFMIEAA